MEEEIMELLTKIVPTGQSRSGAFWIFRNLMRFYSEEFLAPRQTHKLEDHPLSAVRDSLFSIFAGIHHPQPEVASCRVDSDPCTWMTHSQMLSVKTHLHIDAVGTREWCVLHRFFCSFVGVMMGRKWIGKSAICYVYDFEDSVLTWWGTNRQFMTPSYW